MPMQHPSLYRRILGTRFEALPEVLRRFHEQPGGGRARGTFRVERNRGRLRDRLATLLEMPDPGSAVPITLEVVVEGDRERWIRGFGVRRMETVQWGRAGLLMEAYGRTTFSSELVVDGPWLRYEFRRAWYSGISLPRRLAPHVEGTVCAGLDGWRVDVRVAAPFVGWLVHYEGWIAPE